MKMPQSIKRVKTFVLRGNNCSKCPCCWSEYSCDDWDAGCCIGRELDSGCRLILPIRKLLKRRNEFFEAHEYDGIEEFFLRKEEQENLIEARIRKLFETWSTWLPEDFSLEGFSMEEAVRSVMVSVIEGRNEYDCRHPVKFRTLRDKWKELLAETSQRAVFWLKSWVCKP